MMVRRRLLEAAKNLRDNGTPVPCARTPQVYAGVRGLSLQLPRTVNWLDGFKKYVLPNGATQ
jgi:hypothetical protein